MDRSSAITASRPVGVNAGSLALAGDFSAGARPLIVQGMFRIEVAGRGVCCHRLANHDLSRLDGRGRANHSWFRVAKIEDNTGTKARSLQDRPGERGWEEL